MHEGRDHLSNRVSLIKCGLTGISVVDCGGYQMIESIVSN